VQGNVTLLFNSSIDFGGFVQISRFNSSFAGNSLFTTQAIISRNGFFGDANASQGPLKVSNGQNRAYTYYEGSATAINEYIASFTNSTERMRITGDGSVGIGTTSPNASALLDVSSTTKGFLPPRMTGAQAEAIATPAAGLMVYSTDGSGTTITSLGWWGYNGTTWVKLN
jgi:hypothetical protein